MTHEPMLEGITDAMIEAGIVAKLACEFHETGVRKEVAEVWRAMEAARRPDPEAGVGDAEPDAGLKAILAKDDTAIMLDELREIFGADIDVDSRFTIGQIMTAMERGFEQGKAHIEMVHRAMHAARTITSTAEGDATPIPMMLFCPKCGLQHIDAPDERTPDWQVGDLAVCVEAKKTPPGERPSGIKKGGIYRVARVVVWAGKSGLEIEGFPSSHPTRAWLASAFRKIRPDEHEACEPEFVTLLKRIKVSA